MLHVSLCRVMVEGQRGRFEGVSTVLADTEVGSAKTEVCLYKNNNKHNFVSINQS